MRAAAFILTAVIAGTALGLSMAACADHRAPPPKVVTQDVNLAVATSCVPQDLAPKPAYTDSDAALRAAKGPAERYQLVAANRPVRVSREDILEAVVDACRKAAP